MISILKAVAMETYCRQYLPPVTGCNGKYNIYCQFLALYYPD